MKKFVILWVLIFSVSCSEKQINIKNPYLYEVPVSLRISLNINRNLLITHGYIIDYSQGIKGIIVFNNGSEFLAFDMACPNQPILDCSTLVFEEPFYLKCDCSEDNNTYSLISGYSTVKTLYPLHRYRVINSSDNEIIIVN